MGITTTALALLLFVALLGVHHLLQRVEHEQEGMQNDSRRSWLGRKVALLRDTLVKSIPLSASRIAVVVLQIVVQVLFPACNLLFFLSVAISAEYVVRGEDRRAFMRRLCER